jgi:hypothetical protein
MAPPSGAAPTLANETLAHPLQLGAGWGRWPTYGQLRYLDVKKTLTSLEMEPW